MVVLLLHICLLYSVFTTINTDLTVVSMDTDDYMINHIEIINQPHLSPVPNSIDTFERHKIRPDFISEDVNVQAVAHVLVIGQETEGETGLHFPGCLWKSILCNSLLPSCQIKGPLLKKRGEGDGGERGGNGATLGGFIAEQSLRAVNIISVGLHNENYSLFVVVQVLGCNS